MKMSKQVFDQESAFRSIIGMGAREEGRQAPDAGQPGKEPAEAGGMALEVSGAELKTKRAHFLVRPSVYEAASRKCREMGISMNSAVNQLLEQWGAAP